MSSRIGTAIREARQAAGMRDKDLVKRAGLRVGVIELQHIERGIKIPDHETLLRICDQFLYQDTAAWFWLLAEDLWSPEIVAAMKAHAVAEAR